MIDACTAPPGISPTEQQHTLRQQRQRQRQHCHTRTSSSPPLARLYSSSTSATVTGSLLPSAFHLCKSAANSVQRWARGSAMQRCCCCCSAHCTHSRVCTACPSAWPCSWYPAPHRTRRQSMAGSTGCSSEHSPQAATASSRAASTCPGPGMSDATYALSRASAPTCPPASSNMAPSTAAKQVSSGKQGIPRAPPQRE